MQKKYFMISLLSFLILSSCTKQPSQQKQNPTSQPIVSGTIEISKDLQATIDPLAVIFIIARNEMGQIAAVKKLLPPFQYPLDFSLGNKDVMIQGTQLTGKLKLSARIDADGNANPPGPGDIVGETQEVEVETEGVKMLLDKKL